MTVGRIVYTVDAMPAITPVNYVVDGESILIRTASTNKLAAAGRNEIVAFEADRIDPQRRAGWSVVITGRASEITDPTDLARVGALPLRSWVLDGTGRYIRIHTDLVTGRRLQ